jgi:hypothetical protein
MEREFADANRKIKNARVALQDGRSLDAAQLASTALAIIASGDASTAEVPVKLITPDRYKGAKVLNARGIRVGEIRRIENAEVIMSIGGAAGLFGFLHFGGQEVRAPLDRVLVGEPKTIGSTFVALPVLATAPDDIRNQMIAEARGRDQRRRPAWTQTAL